MFDHFRPSKKANVLFLVQNLHFCMKKSKKTQKRKRFSRCSAKHIPKIYSKFVFYKESNEHVEFAFWEQQKNSKTKK